MSALASLLSTGAAFLLASLMTVSPDARSSTQEESRYAREGGEYEPRMRGDNGNHYGWYKKNKKKRPRSEPVQVPEPPMIVLLGAGLLAAGFVAWRERRKR
jgi:hypothetical protein